MYPFNEQEALERVMDGSSWSDFCDLLKAAGFRQIEFSIVPSNVYESMPRLLERGVHLYQVIATTPSQPTSGQ